MEVPYSMVGTLSLVERRVPYINCFLLILDSLSTGGPQRARLTIPPIINRVFAKSRLVRFGLQHRVWSKTETKPNFGFKKVCEEQSVKFSVFDRMKIFRSKFRFFFEPTKNHKP